MGNGSKGNNKTERQKTKMSPRNEVKDTNPTQSGTEGKPKDDNMKTRRRDRSQMFGVFIGSMVRSTRVSDLKKALNGKGVQPCELIWKGGKGIAFAYFDGGDEIFEKLNGLTVCNKEVNVEKIKTKVKEKKSYAKEQAAKGKSVEDEAAMDKKGMKPHAAKSQRKSNDNRENVTAAHAGEKETTRLPQKEKDVEQQVVESSSVTIDDTKMEVDSLKQKQDEETDEKTNVTLNATKNECNEEKPQANGEKIAMQAEVKYESQEPISVDMVPSKQVGLETLTHKSAESIPTDKVESGDKTSKLNQEETEETAISTTLENSLVFVEDKENAATNVTEMSTQNKEGGLKEKSSKPNNKEANSQQPDLVPTSERDQAEVNKSGQKEEGIAVPKSPQEEDIPKVPERSEVEKKTKNEVSQSIKGKNIKEENDERNEQMKEMNKSGLKEEGIADPKPPQGEEMPKVPERSKVTQRPKDEIRQSVKGEKTKKENDEVTKEQKLKKKGEGMPASKAAKEEVASGKPEQSKVEKRTKNEESQSKSEENTTKENVKESSKTNGKPNQGDDPEKCAIS